MRMIAIALLALLTLSDAKAESHYAWCADYGGDSGPGTNCGFVTLEQCRWAISGNGGFCRQNLFYRGPSVPVAPRKPTARR